MRDAEKKNVRHFVLGVRDGSRTRWTWQGTTSAGMMFSEGDEARAVVYVEECESEEIAAKVARDYDFREHWRSSPIYPFRAPLFP